MKTRLFFLVTLLLIANQMVLAQTPTFTETLFKQFNDAFRKDPVKVLKETAHKDMVFVNGFGQIVPLTGVISFYTKYAEPYREVSQIHISQVGTAAVVTGTIEHHFYPKGQPELIQKYTGRFAYNYAFKGGKWLIIGVQHIDITETSEEIKDEIRAVIKAETNAFFSGEPEKILDYWSKGGYREHHHKVLKGLIDSNFAVGDDLNKAIEIIKKHPSKFSGKATHSQWNVQMRGTTAWATYIQKIEDQASEKTSERREIRILEKENGEWKIVFASGIEL